MSLTNHPGSKTRALHLMGISFVEFAVAFLVFFVVPFFALTGFYKTFFSKKKNLTSPAETDLKPVVNEIGEITVEELKKYDGKDESLPLLIVS